MRDEKLQVRIEVAGFEDLTLPCDPQYQLPQPEPWHWLPGHTDLIPDALGVLEFFRIAGDVLKPRLQLTAAQLRCMLLDKTGEALDLAASVHIALYTFLIKEDLSRKVWRLFLAEEMPTSCSPILL